MTALLLATLAFAQAPVPEGAPPLTLEPVELAFQIVLHDRVDAGNAQLTVEPSPKGTAGVWRVHLVADLRMGPATLHMEETTLLDKQLAVIGIERTTQRDGAQAGQERVSWTRKGKTWSMGQQQQGKAAQHTEYRAAHAHYDEVSWAMAMGTVMADLPASSQIELPRIDWPTDGPPRLAITSLVHRGSVDTTLLGQPVHGQVVEVQGSQNTHLLLDDAGHLLAAHPPGGPVRFVVCPSEGCQGLIEAATPPEHRAVLATVRSFMHIMSGKAPPSTVQDLVAWDPLYASRADVFAETSRDGFPAAFEQQLAKASASPLPADATELLVQTATIDIDGDQATVHTVAGEMRFILVRQDRRWLLSDVEI